MLKRSVTAALAALLALPLASCEYVKQHETAQGAIIGTAAGAGLGAVIGEVATGDAGKGALIGGALGAAAGTTAGYLLERQRNRLAAIPNTQVVEQPYTPPGYQQPVQTLNVTMDSAVLFDYDSANLRPEAQQALYQISRVILDPQFPPPRQIIITGHTDSIGDDNYNLGLSQRRADSVRQYLMMNGVNGNSIVAYGAGERYPVSTNATPEGRQLNRRVEIRIIPG